MAAKRVVRFDQGRGRDRRGGQGHGQGHRSPRGRQQGRVQVEVPRYTVPGYISSRLDDIANCPPGHRFLLYFQGAAYKTDMPGADRKAQNRKRDELTGQMDGQQWGKIYGTYRPGKSWLPLKDTKKFALKSATSIPRGCRNMIQALRARQSVLAATCGERGFRFHARLTAPLAIGLGNPHPVENGFSFLQPYGIPYIPGSGIKGSLRRSAEELALFNPESGWTIPLVWMLFGFDGSSGYLAPSPDLPDELLSYHQKWQDRFAKYAKTKAAADPVLTWFLAQDSIRDFIPAEFRSLADDPAQFCLALQGDDNTAKRLRRSLHWQGLLRFWDVIPDAESMAVDILNPHHKAYFEGNTPPVEVEAPKPVFFLIMAPGADMVITCELSGRCPDAPIPTRDTLRSLLEKAVAETLEWTGLGGKTAVGYGVGVLDEKITADERHGQGTTIPHQNEESGLALKKQQQSEEIRQRAADPEEQQRQKLNEFIQFLPKAAELPGRATNILDRIKKIDDPDLRKACLRELRTRFKGTIKKGIKNKKKWAKNILDYCKVEGV